MSMAVIGSNINPVNYAINKSLRFRSSASASLSRTPAITGNQQKMTLSFWVKRGTLTTHNDFLNCGSAVSNFFYTGFGAADGLALQCVTGSTEVARLSSAAVFRDPSSWYHIVYSIDMTQASSANGLRLYVNGVQQTVTITSYVQNASLYINTVGIIQYFGRASLAANEYLDGYLAEVNFIDGQALTPSSFGLNNNGLGGVWQPSPYTGTYGTNGFYLPFTDNSSSAALGYDFSGNGNNWTTNNVSVYGATVQSFTSSTTWTAPAGITSVRYLVVAGGGGGGTATTGISMGGGGGAGGLLQGQLSVIPGNTYTVTIGAGGSALTNGGNSVFGSITATGGGAGAGGTTSPVYAQNGGSGGGGMGYTGFQKGSGIPGQGYDGGSAGSVNVAGGGGGSSGVGGSAPTGTVAGNGGPGTVVNITGSNVTYAGGGGGGAYLNETAGTGGSGGGGNGGSNANGSNATGYGSGGGGAGQYGNTNIGGSGSSGIVIIAYGSSTTYDSMTEVPTLTGPTAGNFATLNPIGVPYNTGTASGGNLNWTGASAADKGMAGTIAMNSGKWYWECVITATAAGSSSYVGIAKTAGSADSNANKVYLRGDGYLIKYGSSTGPYTTFTTGDIIGVAYDYSAQTLSFYKNNTLNVTATGINLESNLPWVGGYTTTESWSINFGQRPFTYTPPTGYVSLNTYNLPNSTVLQGNKYMNVSLWTGNSTGSTTQTITNSGSMKPDFLWGKSRSTAYNHVLIDSVRGVTKLVYSDLSNAEVTNANALSSFNSNGFTVGTDAGGLNDSGKTFVGWQWQAGQGTTSSNTSGTVTSTVSVNASAGFSVVTYTGTLTAAGNATIGHGLGVAPSMIISKARNNTSDWVAQTPFIAQNKLMYLNKTDALQDSVALGAGTLPLPTSTTFGSSYLFGSNVNGYTYVAYCWAEIAGFSKFGKYVGNGSSDGTFVYTGFRPAYVMIKGTDVVSDWVIKDYQRANNYNPQNGNLYADLSNAEDTTASVYVDLLSNGFKLRGAYNGTNGSGYNYVYAAFAENPFKVALAR